jgi:hypothetical protein
MTTNKGYGMGWWFESRRHALAAKGIRSKKAQANIFTYQFPFDRHHVEEDKVAFNRWGNLQVLKKRLLKDTDGDGVPDREDCRPFDPKHQDYRISPTAFVRRENGKLILKSYSTDVAYIEDGKAVVKGMYSKTTARHIRQFLKNEGFNTDGSFDDILKRYPESDEEKAKAKSEEKEQADSMLKTTAMVAAMGEFFADTKKEKNDWKLRMLKAGLENRGFEVPEDWDKLSEEEKEARLNKVIAIAK